MKTCTQPLVTHWVVERDRKQILGETVKQGDWHEFMKKHTLNIGSRG